MVRQASTRLNWKLSTGVGFSRFEPRFGLSRRFEPLDFNDVTISAGALIMYSLPREGTGDALVDFALGTQFPQLYAHGPGGRPVGSRTTGLQLQASWYFVDSPRSVASVTSASGRTP